MSIFSAQGGWALAPVCEESARELSAALLQKGYGVARLLAKHPTHEQNYLLLRGIPKSEAISAALALGQDTVVFQDEHGCRRLAVRDLTEGGTALHAGDTVAVYPLAEGETLTEREVRALLKNGDTVTALYVAEAPRASYFSTEVRYTKLF